MTYTFDSFNYFIRLQKGDHLAECLTQFAAKTGCEGGWLSGLGAVSQVQLGFYNLPAKTYQWQTFKGLRELTGLQGNAAFNQKGELMFHLHGTFADENYQVVGGHVKDLVAAATVELFVHRSYQPLTRVFDDEVGLELLNLSESN